MKVSTSSIKELESKIQKAEEKVSKEKLTNSELRKENRSLRKRIRSLSESRDNWKQKNKGKSGKIKGLQKEIRRKSKPKRHHYSVSMIQLCVLLRVSCGCSYRSICKVLRVLELCLCLEFEKTPCANTIENWVAKMGLSLIKNAGAKVKEEVCLIIDESLKLGSERVLLTLLTPSTKRKQGALSHSDVEVGYLGGKKSWTGEKIKEQISELIETKELRPTYILSDEDSKLLKSARLLELPHLPDINHAVARCLQNVYKKSEAYKELMKLIGAYSGKSVNQDLTYLRPPNQRIKARFMNQKPVLKWALTILREYDQLKEKEQTFFKELKGYKTIILSLNKCIELCERIVKPLKEKGLSQITLKGFTAQLENARKDFDEDPLIISFIDSLTNYKNKYAEFCKGRVGQFNISSDVIESLFGLQKSLAGTNKLVGVSLLDLELAVHCKTETAILAASKIALENIFMTNLTTWRLTHSSVNQAVERNKFFKKRA